MKAVFLDRDGVINEHIPSKDYYVTSWDKFKFIQRAKEAIADLSKTDHKILVVTNQQAVAKGRLTLGGLYDIHHRMVEEINVSGGRIDGVYFCPHREGECECRKPLPGMLDRAAEDFQIDLSNSWVVGDSKRDILMGNARRCRTIFIGEQNPFSADFTAKDLYLAVSEVILK